MNRIIKPSFTVIGKEGSTRDGEGFIQRLWSDANAHFEEVAPLAKRDAQGDLVGVWGAMTDFTRSFQPWEQGFSQGLYLAGVECVDNAQPPQGWTRWEIPAFEYLQLECSAPDTFMQGLQLLKDQGLTLAGAVHDFTDPVTGKMYMMFPVNRG